MLSSMRADRAGSVDFSNRMGQLMDDLKPKLTVSSNGGMSGSLAPDMQHFMSHATGDVWDAAAGNSLQTMQHAVTTTQVNMMKTEDLLSQARSSLFANRVGKAVGDSVGSGVGIGGVDTAQLRQAVVDKGNWNLLARFAMQYPVPALPSTQPSPSH
jgi:hypothetical protein